VRMEGLEPTRREALDPKSSMSTNFITSAVKQRSSPVWDCKDNQFSNSQKEFCFFFEKVLRFYAQF